MTWGGQGEEEAIHFPTGAQVFHWGGTVCWVGAGWVGGGAFICVSCEAGVDFRILNKKSFQVARHCRSRVSTLQYVEPSGDGGPGGNDTCSENNTWRFPRCRFWVFGAFFSSFPVALGGTATLALCF